MLVKTKEEIKEFVKNLYGVTVHDERICDFKITVSTKEDYVDIAIGRMYEYADETWDGGVPISVSLLKFSKFFETKNINESRWASYGCETCNYGSNYEMNFVIKPGDGVFNHAEVDSALKFFEEKDDGKA